MPFELPPLNYAFDALQPTIDARTVEIHYTKHHATYLKNFNAALEDYPDLAGQPVEDILKNLKDVPETIRTAVRNNGGGYYNHNLYWSVMAPGAGGEPKGDLGLAIEKTFKNFSAFKEQFEKAGVGRFGSGYAWLSMKTDGGLTIHSTANQDTPLEEGLFPLLVVDVWEHAYYLNYQNRRPEYLSKWWEVVDWEAVDRRFSAH